MSERSDLQRTESWHFQTGRVAILAVALLCGSCAERPSGSNHALLQPGETASESRPPSPPTDQPPDDFRLASGYVTKLDLYPAGEPGRTIEIYPTETNSKNIFYSTPMLALIEAPNPVANYPATVWKADPDDSGTNIRLHFVVMLWTPSLELALRHKVTEDLSITMPVDTFDRVYVRPWPVHQIIAALRDPAGNEVARSNPVDAGGGYEKQEVTIAVPTSALPAILAAARDPNPWLQPTLQWTYTWQDVLQKYAQAEAKTSVEIAKQIESQIAAQQKNPGDPIFQDQAQTISQNLSQKVRQTVATNSPDLLAQVSIDTSTFLAPETIDLTKPLNPGDQTALSGYLQPLLKKYQESTENRENTTHTHEDKTNIKLGAKLGVGPVGSDFSIGKEETDKLQTENGVDIKKSTDSSSYEPYQIHVYRVSSGYQNVTNHIVKEAFVAAGLTNAVTPQAPLPLSFTMSKALAALIVPATAETPPVPVGAIVAMYLSPADIAKLAPQWLPADGRQVDDSRSPLDGRRLPNLVDKFVLGSAANSDITPDNPQTANGTRDIHLDISASGLTEGTNTFDETGWVGTPPAQHFVTDTRGNETSADHRHHVTVNGSLDKQLPLPPYRRLVYMVRVRP